MARPVVVLPQPRSRRRGPSVSPAWSVRLTPSTALHRADACGAGARPDRESAPCRSVDRAAAAPPCRAPAAARGDRRARDGAARRRAPPRSGRRLAWSGATARSGGSSRGADRAAAARAGSAGGRGSPPGSAPGSAAGRESASSRASPPLDARHAVQQRHGIGMARRAEDVASTGPVSTMRPPYITATRCATSATTPRSWVMRMTAAPVSAWRRASSASTCACTVTSSAVVGSSAMMRLRPARHRHGDDRALAHAAGELVRILARRGRPGPGCRPRAAAPPARARRLAARRGGRARPGPRSTWRPTAGPGSSVVVGSWKMMPTSRPRRRRRVSASAVATRRPPAGPNPRPRALSGRRPVMAREVDALAGARLADDAEHLVGDTRRSSMPRTAGTARPAPPNATVSAADREDGLHRGRVLLVAADGLSRQFVNPTVRATNMLSMSCVKPPMFLAATIRPKS